jgi:glutamate-5-semialdehyde dehydrogenase
MNAKELALELGQTAKQASRVLASTDIKLRNRALIAMAKSVDRGRDKITHANVADVADADAHGLDKAMQDRLLLTEGRIDAMVEGLEAVARLPDPINDIRDVHMRPSGIRIGYMNVPLGVVAVIYESRPNVTADAAALILKSGNAAILRGGSESLRSNLAIAECLRNGLKQVGLAETAIQVVDTADRDIVGHLLSMTAYIDMLVPRGGKSLVARLSKEARVPLLKHLDGICHVYVDAHADIQMALDIAINAKTQRYGVCNTMETLLVHRDIAARLLPPLAKAYASHGVELRGCAETLKILAGISAVSEEDWSMEYLAPILSIRVVSSLEEAVEHINRYGSQHTDSIVTDDLPGAKHFLQAVDSSSVMHNVSTRFADGHEYGLGAEIGISTDKLHARGPVGLEGLTSRKYIVLGDGNIRQ